MRTAKKVAMRTAKKDLEKRVRRRNGALINEILSPLKEATLKLSSFATITIHLVFPILVDLKTHMDDMLATVTEAQDTVLMKSISDMIDKYNKYFETMPVLYIIASIFNPSFKMRFIEHIYCDELSYLATENRGHFERVCS